jgi:hypothetical protein
MNILKITLIIYALLHGLVFGAESFTHTKQLTGLNPNTTYHYRVITKNTAGEQSASTDYVFTTNGTGQTWPTLVNPIDPMTKGAKCDGVTNDTAAFQQSVNERDVLVPAGKTCVINGTVFITTNNRHIQCGTNTIIKQNVTGPIVFEIKEAVSGNRLTGVSVAGCYFLGTNTVPPTTDWNDSAKHWNFPILARDRVDNVTIINNTFDRFYGQAMFQTTGVVDGGHGDQVTYNSFKNCGYYGVAFVAHTNGYIGHNTAIDCAIGIENDNPGQNSGGNILEYNTVTAIYGKGSIDLEASVMLSGGCTGNSTNIVNYSTNIVRNNAVSGVANSLGYHPGWPSRLYICTKWIGQYAAQYSNNSCTSGCQIIP